jgi:hypothetical protein
MADMQENTERRRAVRITLIGPARFGSRESQRAISAVLDNANRAGAGFRAKETFDVQEPVTVCFAFLDQNGSDKQEKLAGRIAWSKAWEKGFLIGVVWDHAVEREKNPWLATYLEQVMPQPA